MNGNILILKCITDIQKHGNESMYSCDINIYYQRSVMFHWTFGRITINTFNLRTPICTVPRKNNTCIRTFTLINNSINEWAEDFFPSGRDLIGVGYEIRLTFCSCRISQIRLLSSILYEVFLYLHQCHLGWEVSLGEKLQDVKPQVWLDKIWSKYLQDLYYVRSSFWID